MSVIWDPRRAVSNLLIYANDAVSCHRSGHHGTEMSAAASTLKYLPAVVIHAGRVMGNIDTSFMAEGSHKTGRDGLYAAARNCILFDPLVGVHEVEESSWSAVKCIYCIKISNFLQSSQT